MKSNFRRNLIVGFGFSLVLLIISGVASYVSIRNLVKSSYLVDHTNDVINGLEQALSRLTAAETTQRGFLATGNEAFLENYQPFRDSTRAYIQKVKELTVDNELQQQSADELMKVADARLEKLRLGIERKRVGLVNVNEMLLGKALMDDARRIANRMRDRERALLAERTDAVNRFAASTPAFIILASLMAIAITLVSFMRVSSDFKRRMELQDELLGKDEDITRRINIIRAVSERIAEGDYSVRVQDSGSDGLGTVAFSLNKMATSLEYSFSLLADKEWLQTGIANLNEKMLGENEISILSRNVLEFVATYTESQIASLYLTEGMQTLKYTAGYAFDASRVKEFISFGEGLIGEAARTGTMQQVKGVKEDQVLIHYGAGALRPASIIALPLVFEKKVMGVMEIASVKEFTEKDIAFLEAISHAIGVSINSIHYRKRLQELLEETQSQSEELQAQHNELENINSELEVQTEKLQASEEELKVQQEELVEANEELEERARLLEERNQLVYERNIEIQKKARELEQSTRYKSEFLANMSHELRTPLNSILLLSRLMSENNQQNLTGEQMEYARVIQSSGQGLLTLIDEILDLSKIESGRMDLVYNDVSVPEVMNELKALFEPVAQEKGIAFRVNIAEDAPRTIETDKLRLEQILKNLVSNALKFTSAGFVEVSVHMPQHKGRIAFTVKDTGIGISTDKQALVFEAFRQADGSTRRKYGGTGLGLSISRELSRLLGGEIRLQSEPDKGSEFTAEIPLSKTHAGEAPPPDEALPAPVTAAPAIQEAPKRFVSDVIPEAVPDDRAAIETNDKVIMIVEDDTGFARSLLEFTRQRGYKGVVTVRGDEVISLATKYQPVGILLDIQLPVKDGWEVMEDLKANAATRHIPVHMMSSYEARYKSLSKGAVDFINKPVAYEKMEDIFSKIEFMLHNNPRKVLIVEENPRHARALAYYLENFAVNTEIKDSVSGSVQALQEKEVNCVILDMGVPNQQSYDTLEVVKKSPGLENVPIIIFTGRNLSKAEELRIKQYADSIVIKTAHSYQRILDEVSLFLHLVEGKREQVRESRQMGILHEVLKNKTVLIADDDIRNIYSLTKALEAYNMQVISATDGREALAQLQAHPEVDIVLMDMMMPEMDGYESTRQIKANPAFRRLPVIAVTAKAMVGDREKCIAAGASDYISKPVDIDQLLSLLRVWLYDNMK